MAKRALAPRLQKVVPAPGWKHCRGCREDWPSDTEFFFACKASKDGLHSSCKACFAEMPSVAARKAARSRYLTAGARERIEGRP
jgi:hypothetical protein